MDFGTILRKGAWLYADHLAVVCEDRKQTYEQLFERSSRLVNGLADLGVHKGDRVATLEDNCFGTLEKLGAYGLGGLVRCQMNSRYAVDQHLYILNVSGAKALIVNGRHYEELAPRLEEAPELQHVIVQGDDSDGAIDYETLLDNSSPEDPGILVDEDDPHILAFSAGTTGKPKGILHTTRSWMGMSNEMALMLPRIDEEDNYLAAGPLSHAASTLTWPVIARGATHVVMPTFDPGRALQLIEEERCTMTLLIPTMIQMMISHPEARRRDLSSLRSVVYAGAPIAERTLRDALAVWGNIMYQSYGQTESLPATVLAPRHHVLEGEGRRWLRSAGRPTPNSMVRILDEKGNALPPNELGEISIVTPGAMAEIWDDPQATATRKAQDGAILTRDIGYLDEDGFLYMADRKEDLIISGGFNIWPAEVENALLSHPAVLEAAVIGVPHEKWGETPVAAVVLYAGENVSEQDLTDWCRDKLGSVKKPTRIVFRTESLPKNPVGKLLRRAVREQHFAGETVSMSEA